MRRSAPLGVGLDLVVQFNEPICHRLGVRAVAEQPHVLSLVDESEYSFVEPEVIAADPELHRIWLEAVQASQAAYRDLADRLTGNIQGQPRPDPPAQVNPRGGA